MVSTAVISLKRIFHLLWLEKVPNASGSEPKLLATMRELFVPLVAASTALSISGIYRTANVVFGYNPSIQNEILSINFDTSMCLVVVMTFNFYHPGILLKQRRNIYLDVQRVHEYKILPI
jgi:hypothetical protein